MRNRPIRVLELTGSPEHRGAVHGAAFHNEIRCYTAERVGLAAEGTWSGSATAREDVLALAEAMLPAHALYDAELYEEMVLMAEAAGISPAEAVIVGGFTDFADTLRAAGGEPAVEDDCTAVIVPDDRAAGAGFLAQTWDMHDTATEHVVVFDIQPDGAPRALVFSTVGCLGQIGMNEAGVAIGINNLTAANGRVGVTWPFVVRSALTATSFEGAVKAIVDAPVAGGHSYLVFAEGRGCIIEAMPGGCSVLTMEPGRVLAHTNHCLASEAADQEAPRPADLVASSLARLERAQALLADGDVDAERLMELTREPEAICRRSEPPHHVETCGAVVMRPGTGDLWAVWGVPADNDYEHFTVYR